MLYRSFEQQNEFQSRNYCPIIFRIIKASSASIQTITSPSYAFPRPPPTASPPAYPVSSACASHFVKANSSRRCWFISGGVGGWGGVGRTRMDRVAPVSFVLRPQCLFFLLPLHFDISLFWKISIGTLGRKVRV